MGARLGNQRFISDVGCGEGLGIATLDPAVETSGLEYQHVVEVLSKKLRRKTTSHG